MRSNAFLLGVDPGLANMGWSVVDLTSESERVIEAGVLRTEPSAKKRKVLASDDNVRRSRDVAGVLISAMSRYRISAVCVESMSFPRSSSAAAKMAMCWGSLAALSVLNNLPIIQVSPQEIKKTLCGKKDASKDEVAAAVEARYGNLDVVLSAVVPSCREHAYDSIGAVIAALEKSEVVRAIRGML